MGLSPENKALVDQLKMGMKAVVLATELEWLMNKARAEATEAQARRIEAILSAYDTATAQCPINDPVKRATVKNGPCPRCGATSAGPCWLEVVATNNAVRDVRALLPTDIKEPNHER